MFDILKKAIWIKSVFWAVYSTGGRKQLKRWFICEDDTFPLFDRPIPEVFTPDQMLWSIVFEKRGFLIAALQRKPDFWSSLRIVYDETGFYRCLLISAEILGAVVLYHLKQFEIMLSDLYQKNLVCHQNFPLPKTFFLLLQAQLLLFKQYLLKSQAFGQFW